MIVRYDSQWKSKVYDCLLINKEKNVLPTEFFQRFARLINEIVLGSVLSHIDINVWSIGADSVRCAGRTQHTICKDFYVQLKAYVKYSAPGAHRIVCTSIVCPVAHIWIKISLLHAFSQSNFVMSRSGYQSAPPHIQLRARTIRTYHSVFILFDDLPKKINKSNMY